VQNVRHATKDSRQTLKKQNVFSDGEYSTHIHRKIKKIENNT